MLKSSDSLSFADVASAFAKANALLCPSEAHGIQSGLICAKKQDESGMAACQVIVTREIACQDSACTDFMSKLYRKTLLSMEDVQFAFSPFLPADDVPFLNRVSSLTHWCRGFLCGLGMAGIDDNSLPELTNEAVSDISKIAYTEVGAEGTEEDEKAYFELVEYVKVAVQTIQVELSNKTRVDFVHHHLSNMLQ